MVDNLIDEIDSKKVPIGIYSLYAVKNIGKNVLIYSDYKDEIIEKIVKSLGADVEFVKQEIPKGHDKPLGHGDAARQAKHLIENYDYIITNFSNDSNSRKTIILSVLFFHILTVEGYNPGEILPVEFVHKPRYPVLVDDENRPFGIEHAKLKKKETSLGQGFGNVGLRVYNAQKMLEYIKEFESIFESENSYSSINNGNNEFALDNINEKIIEEKKSWILPICYSFEFRPAKTIDATPNFLEAIRKTKEKDGL